MLQTSKGQVLCGDPRLINKKAVFRYVTEHRFVLQQYIRSYLLFIFAFTYPLKASAAGEKEMLFRLII